MTFPRLLRFQSMTREAGWLAFYNPIAQREISVANYWNDPNHQWSDHEFNHFLPQVCISCLPQSALSKQPLGLHAAAT